MVKVVVACVHGMGEHDINYSAPLKKALVKRLESLSEKSTLLA